MNRKFILLVTMLAAMAAGRGMAAVATTNAPAANDASTKAPARTDNKIDFDSFKLVRERNIFDMSRTGRIGPKSAPKRVIVDDFTLLGTINSGPYAIFEGSGSEYQKNVKAGDNIGSFKVSAIGSGYVDLLSTNNKTIRMELSTTMRREDKGPWSGPTMRNDTILADSSSGSGNRDASDRSDRSDRSSRSDRSDRRLYRNSRSGGTTSGSGMGEPGLPATDQKSDTSSNASESDVAKRLMERRATLTKDN